MLRYIFFVLIHIHILQKLASHLYIHEADKFSGSIYYNLIINETLINATLSYPSIFNYLKILRHANDSWTINRLSKVAEIYLDDQNISHISNDIFKRLKNLKVLSLKNDSIINIKGFMKTKQNVCNLPYQLKKIVLSFNQLKVINLNTFIIRFPNLKDIDLSHNKIFDIMEIPTNSTHILDENICKINLHEPLRINLAFNYIKYLPMMLPNLVITQCITSLDLSNNRISNFPTNFFKYTVNMEYLNIQNNNIKMISMSNILKYLSNLNTLIISNNPINFDVLDNSSSLHENLQQLDLSNVSNSQIVQDKISETTEILLPKLPALRYLNLSHNYIPIGMHLTTNSFSPLNNLTHLDVSYVSNLYELPHQLFGLNKKLKYANFDGISGIRCNCRYLIWFGNWLREQLNNGSRIVLPLKLLKSNYTGDILYMGDELNRSIIRRYGQQNDLYHKINQCKLSMLPPNDCFNKEPGNTVAGQKLFSCNYNASHHTPYQDQIKNATLWPKHQIPMVKHHPRVLIKVNIGQDIVLTCGDNVEAHPNINLANHTTQDGDDTGNNIPPEPWDSEVMVLSWYYKYKSKWSHIYQKLGLNSSPVIPYEAVPSFGAAIRGSKRFLSDGSLLVKSAQRIDAGLYSCLTVKRWKGKPNHVILEDVPIVLYFGTEYFLEIWKSTILFGVGGAFTFLFFAIVIVYLIKCFKMCQCIHQRAKTQKFGKLIELLQQQSYDEVENLRNHYINQLNKLKETCCGNIESIGYQYHNRMNQFRGYSSHLKSEYMSQMKDCGTYLKDIKGCGSQQMGSVKDNYISQVTRMREYTALQVEKMMDSYTAQVDRLNAFTYTHMDKLREKYKIKAKHIGDMIEMMNLNNCRNSIMALSSLSLDNEVGGGPKARFQGEIFGNQPDFDEPSSSLYYPHDAGVPFDRSRIKSRLDKLSEKGDPFIYQSEAAIRAIWEKAKVKVQELWDGTDEAVECVEPHSFSHALSNYLCPDLFGSQESATFYTPNLEPKQTPDSGPGSITSEPVGVAAPPLPRCDDNLGVEEYRQEREIEQQQQQRHHQRTKILMTKSDFKILNECRKLNGRYGPTRAQVIKRYEEPFRSGGVESSPLLANGNCLPRTTSLDDLASVVPRCHGTIHTTVAMVTNTCESTPPPPRRLAAFDPEEGSVYSLRV